MTEAAHTERAKPKRASKRVLRAWAWIAGLIAFFSPWAVLGLQPKPAASAAPAQSGRQVTIVRKITRRVIVQAAPKPQPVRYVYAGGSGPSSGGGSAPAPSTSTGGSAPP